ncbi:zinc finger matrin-type protein 3-like isoform X3 [Rhynchophorus ferrugineus]|uniref:zinc finger matrin-type protein 3-like isoform X3 n=1 Tax=Rhynchophorus ferrugineus TaxID=354439 RepID=UPI003FCE2546
MKRVLENASNDGYYAENELKKDYHIPKRKKEEACLEAENKSESDHYNINQTPLANSYYNYTYDTSVASAYYGNYSQYYAQYTGYNINFNGENYSNISSVPTPSLQEGPTVDPIKQNIYKALKDIKETPKNYKQNIFESTVPDITDNSLPKELKILFQPLFCKLCTVQLSSNQTAKMHYKSKNHEKKIRKWLIDYSDKTGEPLHKRAKLSSEQVENAQKNPAWYHCDVCDLQLTGRLHAESHYMGKNHQKALLGYRTPAGQGYYDTNGKWVRIKGQKHMKKLKQLGLNKYNDPATTTETIVCTVPSFSDKDLNLSIYRTPSGDYYCPTCNLISNSEGQFIQHWNSKNHAKKAAQRKNAN